jgi:hypothetical protein
MYGKWTSGMRSRALNESGHEEVNDRMNGNKEGDLFKRVAVLLRLNRTFRWEILLMFEDNKNKSAAIFIDPPTFRAYGKQKTTKNNEKTTTTTATVTTATTATATARTTTTTTITYLCNHIFILFPSSTEEFHQ